MSIYYSPLRYPGGKNCIFPFVSSLLYENSILGISYAEPYAGGAGLALRLLFEGYVDRIYINDLDPSIYAFWYAVLNRTDDLCKWINEVDVSVQSWEKYKDVQGNIASSDRFTLAKSTFFLNRTNVSGVLKGGIIGGYEQLGKYKIDARFNKKSLIKRIRRVAELKDRILISNLDGVQFISNLNRRRESLFIYLDPPYYKKGADLYMNFYSDKDHQKLSKKVHGLEKQWMVSYDNHEFILNLYKEDRKLRHKLSQSASNRVGDELFVFSESVNFLESMSSLKSPELCV